MNLKKEEKVSKTNLISITLPVIYVILSIVFAIILLKVPSFEFWRSQIKEDIIGNYGVFVIQVIAMFILPLIIGIVGIVLGFAGLKKKRKILSCVGIVLITIFEICWWLSFYINGPQDYSVLWIAIALALNIILNFVGLRNQNKVLESNKA